MPGSIHLNDIGTRFLVTVKDENDDVVDVSGASLLELKFAKPDNVIVPKTASLYTDGTDGKISYVSVSGDLDVKGTWRFQGYVVVSGSAWHTTIETFKVEENL